MIKIYQFSLRIFLNPGSENVIAMIPGKEKPRIHHSFCTLDHVGMHNTEKFYGADDDGSGTIAIIEIAEAFQKLLKTEKAQKICSIFDVTAEEKGLQDHLYRL